MKLYPRLSFWALQFLTCLMDEGDMGDNIFAEPMQVRLIVLHGLKGKEYKNRYTIDGCSITCIILIVIRAASLRPGNEDNASASLTTSSTGMTESRSRTTVLLFLRVSMRAACKVSVGV